MLRCGGRDYPIVLRFWRLACEMDGAVQ